MAAFNDQSVRQAQAPTKGRKLIFDEHKDAPRGFGLRVTAKGSRAFILRYNSGGKDRLMTIGEYGTWTLAAARKKAGELRRDIDNGTDILGQRRERQAELTVANVIEKFCQSHADKLASGPAIRGALAKHLMPALGDSKITDVRRRDVIAVVEALAQKKGRQAALLLTYTKQLFAWCEDREIIEANPVATLKAQKVAKELSPKSRARVLADEEIRALWNCDQPPEGMHRATLLVLQFILITGQRPGEVCAARLDEVKGNVWTIPAKNRGKTDDDHSVPLTDTALALIKQAAGEEYLFERYSGRPIDVSALSKAVRRCGDELGNASDKTTRWRPHDLRRTMRTGLAVAGVLETVAETTIGHVRKGIAGVYDRHRYDVEKRAALEAWDRRLKRIVSDEPVQNHKVVAFDGATL